MKSTKDKLKKAGRSLANHVHGGRYYRGMGNARTVDLVDRYNDLRTLAIEEGVWYEYCDESGTDRAADAYDFLA